MIAELEEWQNTPDSPEQLRTLPRLKKEDANTEPEWVDTDIRTISGVPVLLHQLNCNGVIHFRAYFALTDYSLEELTRLSQLAGLMGRLPTAKHDALTLQLEIKRWTGMLGFAIITRAEKGREETCTPYLAAFCSALEDYADKALELMTEILTSTRFDDRDKMIAVFRQNEMGVRQRVLSAGHLIGVKNVMSHFSAEGAVKNALDGDVAARYIRRLARDPDKELPGLFRLAERMKHDTICRKRLIFSVTSTEPYPPEKMINAIQEGTPAPAETCYTWESPYAAGYRIPAQTGFAVRGYHLSRTGKNFEGSMWLAASILTLGYLWNRIRVQGGAYGAGLQIDRTGNIFSYSYRDPTPGKTLEADAGASAFLKQFAAQDEDLDSYIISALNELNPLLSARDKGALADGRYMTNYTREEAEQIRRQILFTSPEDLVRCAEWLDAFSRDGAVCVVAHKDALDSCKNLTISDL